LSDLQAKVMTRFINHSSPTTPPPPCPLVGARATLISQLKNRERPEEKLGEARYTQSPSAYISLGELPRKYDDNLSYKGFRPLAGEEGATLGRMYPRMTPLENSLKDCEDEGDLEKDIEELEKLCKKPE